MLRTGAKTDTTLGLSPAQAEFDVGYGVATHEGTGLLTTLRRLVAGGAAKSRRPRGDASNSASEYLNEEGECTTQGGGAEHQVAL